MLHNLATTTEGKILTNAPDDVAAFMVEGDLTRAERDQILEELSPVERARFHSVSPDNGERFLVGRSMLRSAATQFSGQPRENITVTAQCATCGDEHGRPTVVIQSDDGDHRFFASLAHAGTFHAVALSRRQPVGIDLERRRNPEPTLDEIPIDLTPFLEPSLGTLRAWVRYESVVKARGIGIQAPLGTTAGMQWWDFESSECVGAIALYAEGS